jgi:hypothetical protein
MGAIPETLSGWRNGDRSAVCYSALVYLCVGRQPMRTTPKRPYAVRAASTGSMSSVILGVPKRSPASAANRRPLWRGLVCVRRRRRDGMACEFEHLVIGMPDHRGTRGLSR